MLTISIILIDKLFFFQYNINQEVSYVNEKGKVLKILEENKGRNIPGEEIAKTLNISRTSLWKAINSLRNEGYVINAVTNKGYSLATNTDFISKEVYLLIFK